MVVRGSTDRESDVHRPEIGLYSFSVLMSFLCLVLLSPQLATLSPQPWHPLPR